MYQPAKQLMYVVRIGHPHPRFVNMSLNSSSGTDTELAFAMHYSIQGLNRNLGLIQ